MFRTAAFFCLLCCCVLPAQAQDSLYMRDADTLHYTYIPLAQPPVFTDTATVRKHSFLHRLVDYFGESTTDKTFEKKIDFTFAGGPSYSKNTSFGIGLLAAGLYRIDRTDSVTSPSNISIFGNISVSGFYALGVTGNNIFKQNRSRIDYTLVFKSAPRDLWGIGYDHGRNDANKSSYVEKNYFMEARYLHQFLPKTYIGGMLSFEHTRGIKFSDKAETLNLLRGEKKSYTATGIGAILEYDSRDFIPNPYRGIYISLLETFFPEPLGSCGKSLWKTNFTADYYQQVWKGGILAIDLYAEFNSNGTPWPMLARMGGGLRMRGYYEGQYTDNDMITFQLEIRQRIWRRIGCTVWGGAGNVFPQLSEFNWSQTLPNYGIGLRWELKKRVNVRFDYGFGRKTGGFLLNINEAF